VRRRVAVGPHALLQRAPELRLVRLAHEIAPLVVERGVEEEALVVEREVLFGLADPALAERHELLTLGERPHSHGPFLESDRHAELWSRRVTLDTCVPTRANLLLPHPAPAV
jgi:hypothetical protein